MQRYLWQQADGARHAYDVTEQGKPAAGQPLTVLCGETVTPRTQDIRNGDLPCWFDPTCRACAVRLAAALGWTDDEIASMVARWETVTQ